MKWNELTCVDGFAGEVPAGDLGGLQEIKKWVSNF